ncbi:hypothetical protein EXS65_04905 [Candidatus Peribacteria bacterium]|nr:hypothetical protein [Candidatus Peribacteria bacterium]
MFAPNFDDDRGELLSEILETRPHFKATNLAWDITRSQLKVRLSTEAMTCLGLLLDEFGSVPVDTIPNNYMLPQLIAQGLVEDCTLQVQRLRMEKLFTNEKPGNMPLVP